MGTDYEPYSLITIELTSDEQISLLGFIMNHTNCLIAKGDKNNWLPDLERIEEKIRERQDVIDCSTAIISNTH